MVNKYSCLYGDINVSVPDSVEQFDQLAGRNGACLDAATKQVVFHKLLGDVREDIVEACVKAFEFPRLEVDTGKKRKDGSPILVDEDAKDYIHRLFADREWERENPPAQYRDLVASLEIKFDPSATVRVSKGKVLPKMYLEAGERIIANGNGFKWANQFGITLTGEAEADATLLGWQIKAREDAKRREAEAAAKATYA